MHFSLMWGNPGRVTLCALSALAMAFGVGSSSRAEQSAPSVTVYKTATCGCCSMWVKHMREHGFDVRAIDVEDMGRVKATYGVPAALESCHTSLVGGYVLEGHVPADTVRRLLRERPTAAGIAVPGMPAGSPGMEVPGRRDPYAIVTFDRSGQYAVFERR
jgi:hypothetical protein